MPSLFRRREILVPTWWGSLWLLFVLGATVTLLARPLGSWLAVTEPVAGPTPELLVIEGWLGERELNDAAAYARQRGYRHVLTSGGPILSFSPFASFAERAADHLRGRLPAGVALDAVPAPATRQDRSYASAVWVRDWARQHGLPLASVDVYSLGPHARRTRLLYRTAFGDSTRVGIVAGVPHDSDIVRWWTTSEAAKSVATEALSLAWTLCCFWPAPRGTHEERWAVPAGSPPASAP